MTKIDEPWVRTVDGLNWKARTGSTGSNLIQAAETTFKNYENEIEQVKAELQKEREERFEESEADADQLEDKEKVIQELAAELSKLKTLKVKSSVEDSDVEFRFSPRTSTQDNHSAYFSVEHLEEILMYLRINGATDETAVEVNSRGIEAIVKGVGYVLPNKRGGTEVKSEPKKPGILHREYNKAIGSGPLILVSSGIGGSIILVGLKLLGVL